MNYDYTTETPTMSVALHEMLFMRLGLKALRASWQNLASTYEDDEKIMKNATYIIDQCDLLLAKYDLKASDL